MDPTLAVYLFLYNVEKIRYPWRESLRSALALTEGRGSVFVAECASDDGTELALWEEFGPAIKAHRLLVSQAAWGKTADVQVRLANDLLDGIGTDYDFALKLDADEVLHERSFPAFWRDLDIMRRTYRVLGRPHYTHFCPDFDTTFPFIYDRKAVIAFTRSGQRFHDNDACALGGGGIPEYDTRLEIYHYGKVGAGRESEALYKERTFTELYGPAFGFPDPLVQAQWEQGWLDYDRVFAAARARGEFRPFQGTHPSVMAGYIQTANARHARFLEELSNAA